MRLPSRLLLFALLASVAACRAAPTPPNVLLVSIDSLRADHVHAYGYGRETTPTIDTLAAGGVRFANTVSPSSWTLPTHVTLLTGLPPEVHRVEDHRQRLSDRAVTLAETLHAAGYQTAAVVGGPLLRAFYGHDQGFELYDDSMVSKRNQAHLGVTSPGLVDSAIEWIRAWHERGARQPFFFFLHLWDVHYDYAPPAPYDRMFDPDYRGDLDSTDFESNPRIRPGMPERDLQHVIALYDGEIRFTDEQLGRLIATLRALGVLDDTIVVVTADHGDEFFEHGRKGHRKTLYEEIVRVPFVLHYPRRVPAGQVIEPQVRLMDVAPTILGLAKTPRRARLGMTRGPSIGHARDLSPWIDGTADPGHFPRLLAFGRTTGFGPSQDSLRTDTWKVIQSIGRKRITEHYDLQRDPGETERLAGPIRPEGRLAATLDDYRRFWRSQPRRFAEPVEIDREHERRLRALGYIQ